METESPFGLSDGSIINRLAISEVFPVIEIIAVSPAL